MAYLHSGSEYYNYWLKASWEARNLTTPERERLFKVSATKRERRQRIALQRANQNKRIFDQEVGGTQNLWIWKGVELVTTHTYFEGWREKSDGTRERVEFYFGYGYLSSEELFKLRQLYPRNAP